MLFQQIQRSHHKAPLPLNIELQKANGGDVVKEMFSLFEAALALSSSSSSSSSKSSTSRSSSSSNESSESSSDGSDSDNQRGVASSSVGGGMPSNAPPAVAVAAFAPAPLAERVARESLTIFEGDHPTENKIKYKPHSSDLYTSCLVHRGCTRTRTVRPGVRRAQGRPLGDLSAWALASNNSATKELHQAHLTVHLLLSGKKLEGACDTTSSMRHGLCWNVP